MNDSFEWFTRRMVRIQPGELCNEFFKFVEKLNQSRIKPFKETIMGNVEKGIISSVLWGQNIK